MRQFLEATVVYFSQLEPREIIENLKVAYFVITIGRNVAPSLPVCVLKPLSGLDTSYRVGYFALLINSQ